MNDQEYEVYEAAIQAFRRVPDVLDMLVTMERLAASISAAVLDGTIEPPHGPLHLQAEQRAVVSGMAAVERLESLRARSLTQRFTARGGNDAGIEVEEQVTTTLVAAHAAGARELAQAGDPDLVQFVFCMGMVHVEHMVTLRAIRAEMHSPDGSWVRRQPVDTDHLLTVRDAYQLLERLGLFGMLPLPLTYPSHWSVPGATNPLKAFDTELTRATIGLSLTQSTGAPPA